MQVTEIRYENGTFTNEPNQWFGRVQNDESLEATLAQMGYRKLLDTLGSADYGYGVTAYKHQSAQGTRQFLVEHYFTGGDVYMVSANSFSNLMALLHEASTIILASLKTAELP